MKLTEVVECTNGVLAGRDISFAAVSIDTRTLKPGDLFCAIRGERFDGNELVALAEQAGAVAAIVDRPVATALPTVTVRDTRLALAELAGRWRQHYPVEIVGVTGSNGKTTVKEMTAAVLGGDDTVLYTRGNLNNEIGVPLTLLRLQQRHRFGVIEMGANHPGEIAYTSRYARPDVAIITNVGPAHLEGFGSLEGIARAKGEILGALAANGVAVLNRDDPYFERWRASCGGRTVVAFGLNDTADIGARNMRMQVNDGVFVTAFDLVIQERSTPMRLGLAGRHNVINALAAAAAASALNIGLEQIKLGLESVKPVPGRLRPTVSRWGNIVIDDSYNANAASLAAGLQVLAECPGEPWLILGALAELGPDSAQIHRDIGELIKAGGVKRLLATGALARHAVEAFGEHGRFFETQQTLIETLRHELTGRETLLVKGSRSQHMERVVAAITDHYGI